MPRIHFGVGTGELLPLMANAGCRRGRGRLARAPRRRPPTRRDGRALQGNLDPTTCLAPWPVVQAATLDVLARGGGPGHVFNLGHGVLPETDPDVLARVVDVVHDADPLDRPAGEAP